MDNPDALAHEFQELTEQRDLAAYDLVGAVDTVIKFWESQTFDDSFDILADAMDDFKKADAAVDEFRAMHFRQNKPTQGDLHGNRTAA